MIEKSDLVLLLTELENKGIPAKEEISKLYRTSEIPLTTIKLINDNKSIDIVNFYKKLRESYNNKRSKLYINIMKSDENLEIDTNSILTTLTALLNQIFNFKCEDKIMFFKHARADEISKVISIYLNTFNLEPARKLLAYYKADIKVLESIFRR